MRAHIRSWLAAVTAGVVFLLGAAVVSPALAAGCGCVPPPCCAPPTPPPPPVTPCCQPPGHTVNIPGVNVFVGASVIVNAQVSAQASAGAQAASNAFGTVYYGGGGGGSYLAPGPTGLLQGLNVESGQLRRTAYEATRTRIRKVIIEAVCIDDRDVPHPASQVTPDRDIDDAYDGELYRCIAGTHMQATIADYDGRIAFDHGQTLPCAKGDALYHTPAAHGQGGAQVVCRPQKPARDCNERSLLRRFGAGVKILTMLFEEKYTAYREETVQTFSASSSSMSLDGGVGGIMY